MALSLFRVTIVTKSDAPFNVIPAAAIEIKDTLSTGASGPTSSIFSDQAGTTPITQPGAVTDAFGQFEFFGGNDNYNAEFDNNGTPIIKTISPVVNSRTDRLNPLTLAIWQADTRSQVSDVVTTKERSTGDGGGATGDVISGTGTANGTNIVAHNTLSQSFELRQHPSNTIDMYGAASGANSSAAINSAIAIHAGQLNAEKNGYLLDAQVLFASGPCTGLKGIGEIDCVFVKTFNGDAMRIQNQGTTLEHFWIQGDGSNFTGGGVYVVSDDCNIDVRITDTADSCIICLADNAKSLSVDSFLTVTDPTTTFTIRSDGNDGSATPTSRRFKISGGSSGPGFAGMNVAHLSESLCQDVGFDANCSKITMSDCRFTNASADILVLGDAHTFTGNNFGFSTGFNLIFDATCEAVKYDDSNVNSINGLVNSIVQDNSATGNVGTSNSIQQEFVDWSGDIEWKGSTSDAIFGNATVSTSYAKSGRTCQFNLSFIRGSTTTIAIGNWSWTLPFKALSLAAGSVLVKDSLGTWFSGTWVVQGGSNEMFITLEGATGVLNSTDLTFGSGAQIQGTMIYQIASV